jgi:hypothetical protein
MAASELMLWRIESGGAGSRLDASGGVAASELVKRIISTARVVFKPPEQQIPAS